MKHRTPTESDRGYRKYTVSRKHREPLLAFMHSALEASGCRIILSSPPDTAPFKISFETPDGDRMGVLAYPFLANKLPTKNRPPDEYRFQLKYGKKIPGVHELWQDPYGLYTTILLGISPTENFFVGFDPVVHSPTKHFISLEFKEAFVERVLAEGWAHEERERNSKGLDEPVEIIVGGTPKSFLDYVRFEREAVAEDQGHRALLAERRGVVFGQPMSFRADDAPESPYVHALAKELELSPTEVLDLIARAKRLKMAVRGWVAEEHLVRRLQTVEGVSDCERIEKEGSPDIQLRYQKSDLLFVECKNVLRETSSSGFPRVDFQRTRTSKADPCTRYYSQSDFQILAACLHAVTQKWEYSYALTSKLMPHKKCAGKLSNNVTVDREWNREIRGILGEAAAAQ